jgi:BlaI family transcriptional regulator, penicillinase repressor
MQHEDDQRSLTRRERQIMDVIYSRQQASAADVWASLPDRPTRTAVRTMIRILEDKGLLKHSKEGRRFVYRPARPRDRAGQSALRRVLHTFFAGSIEEAVAAHLSDPSTTLTPDELKKLQGLIRAARKREE